MIKLKFKSKKQNINIIHDFEEEFPEDLEENYESFKTTSEDYVDLKSKRVSKFKISNIKIFLSQKKVIVVILIILILIILGLFLNQQKNNKEILNLSSVRGFNVESTKIFDNGIEYEIKNQVLLENGKPLIRVGDYNKNMISKIDNFVFLQDNECLIKYDIDNDYVTKLYYDTMTYSAVGLNYIYYITDEKLYRLSNQGSIEKIKGLVSEKVAFLNGDYFYFIEKNKVEAINLLTDEIVDVDILESGLTDYAEQNAVALEDSYLILYEDGEMKRINYIEEVKEN